MATNSVLKIALTTIARAYPGRFTLEDDTVKVWASFLKDLDDDLLLAAVARFISSAETPFPPTLPEIRREATEIKREVIGLPTSWDAWADLVHAGDGTRRWINENNEIKHEPYRFLHPIIQEVGTKLGWPERFPNFDNEMADRAHFTKAYDAAVTKALQAETQLPQVTAYIDERRLEAEAPRLVDGLVKKLSERTT